MAHSNHQSRFMDALRKLLRGVLPAPILYIIGGQNGQPEDVGIAFSTGQSYGWVGDAGMPRLLLRLEIAGGEPRLVWRPIGDDATTENVLVTSADFDMLAPTTIKGDIIAHTGTTNVRVAVGANDTILVGDSSATPGISYKTSLALLGGIGRLTLGTKGGTQKSISTTWLDIGDGNAVEALIDEDVAPIPSGQSHSFTVYIQDDTSASDVEVRIQDVTADATLASITGIGNGAGTPGFDTTSTFSNIPGTTFRARAQWRRASGTGNATIFSGAWTSYN